MLLDVHGAELSDAGIARIPGVSSRTLLRQKEWLLVAQTATLWAIVSVDGVEAPLVVIGEGDAGQRWHGSHELTDDPCARSAPLLHDERRRIGPLNLDQSTILIGIVLRLNDLGLPVGCSGARKEVGGLQPTARTI